MSASPLPLGRVGIVVPKIGNTAVKRNRLKRRLRELTRLVILPRLRASDVVVRAQRSAYAASFEALRDSMQRVANMIGTTEVAGPA